MPGADQEELLQNYLADMSQNVTSATLKARTDQYKASQDLRRVIQNDGEGDISSWNQMETSIPDIEEQEENPYDGRKVAKSKKVQDTEAIKEKEKETQWWKGGQECLGCGGGFIKKSNVTKCVICKYFVHIRKTCLSVKEDGTYVCGNCEPIQIKPGNRTCQEGELVCKICEKKFNRKYNFIRHMESQHNGKLEPEKETEATSVEIEEIKLPNIEDILKETSLEKFKPKFEEEGVSTEDMIKMTEKDLKEAMKDFGIKRLGDRFLLLNKLRSLKVNMKSRKQKESDKQQKNIKI